DGPDDLVWRLVAVNRNRLSGEKEGSHESNLVYSLYHRRRRATGVRRRDERTVAGLAHESLALTVLFTLNAFFFASLFAVLPRPLPTIDGISAMPWWAPLAGLTGAVAVFAGLALIDKIGAGPVNGLI